MTTLNSKQRASLRARAHALNPVVQVGHAGVTPAVTEQVDAALRAHELIKIKLGRECPVSTDEAGTSLSADTRSSVVQTIGHVVVLFRRNPKKPRVSLKTSPAAAEAASENKRPGRQLRRNRKRREHKRRGGAPRRPRKRS
jgi:RNA-binding protein